MSLPNTQTVPKDEIWAVVSLMGHGETAGRISKTSEWGGLCLLYTSTQRVYVIVRAAVRVCPTRSRVRVNR